MEIEEEEQEQRSEHAPLLPELARSLADAEHETRDAGTVALVLRYGALLDNASVAQSFARAIEAVDSGIKYAAADMPMVRAEQLESAWSKVRAALSEQTTASDLGPKLLAALTSLNMTPAARAEKADKGKGSTAPVVALPSPLQKMRDAAKERNAGAGA